MERNKLDILIFGASGFTGTVCIEYMHKLVQKYDKNISWGIAGRSLQKLEDTLKNIGNKIGVDFSTIPITVADINDNNSLINMTKQTKVLLNCVGPYKHLGFKVVEACIQTGTHQLDLTAEPDFMNKVQVNYDDIAKNKGIYIINACGVDCVPVDLGVQFTQNKFQGTLNSVEVILKGTDLDRKTKGSYVNMGTYESLVHTVNLRVVYQWWKLHKEMQKGKDIPTCEPKLKLKIFPHKHKVTTGWLTIFPTADVEVCGKTQQYMYETYQKRPVQVGVYAGVESFWFLIGILISVGFFAFLAQFRCGRYILMKYPKCFTMGVVDREPPSDKKVDESFFELTFYGKGWKEKSENPTRIFENKPDRCIVTKIRDKNSGYRTTAVIAAMICILFLKEKDKLANDGRGGCFQAGTAFSGTSIIEKLNENGVEFELLYEKDLQ